MTQIRYAGIGSRRTPEPIQEVMFDLGYALAKAGRLLHSGGAENADRPFQEGCEAYCRDAGIAAKERQLIIIPKPNFRGLRPNPQRGIVDFNTLPNKDAALQLAKEYYRWKDPAKREQEFRKWPEWLKQLMGRNGNQVLDLELNNPVNYVLCWTPDGSLDGALASSGGTGQALRIAKAYNIPVFNLKRERHFEFVHQHILKRELVPSLNYSP